MLHPNAAKLALQLGRLMKAYLPDLKEGHDLLEIAASFSQGLAEPALTEDVTVDLPMADYDISAARKPFLIDAPTGIRLDVSSDYVIAVKYPVKTPEGGDNRDPFAVIKIETPETTGQPALVSECFSANGARVGKITLSE